MTPEKLHLALNHFVFLFPLAALIPLVIGLIIKSRATLISGICIALVGGLLTGLVMGTGEDAYKRYEEGPVAAFLDSGAESALEHHEEMAHNWAKVMYALAAVSIGALISAFVKPKWLYKTGMLVILLSVASIFAGVYIADSGGKIRRPDFRENSPSNTQNTDSDHHNNEHE